MSLVELLVLKTFISKLNFLYNIRIIRVWKYEERRIIRVLALSYTALLCGLCWKIS